MIPRIARTFPVFLTGALLFLCGVLLISILFFVILNLPGIPYNVKELFLDQGAFYRLLFFSSAILWTGSSAALITNRVVKSRVPYILMPVLIGASGIISYWMLAAGVTYESVSDIVGSPYIWRFVVNEQIWGQRGQDFFLAIDSPVLIHAVERHVRYLALYSPLVFFLVISSAGIEKPAAKSRISAIVYFSLIALPWLIISKIIVYDYAATDNLTELIANGIPLYLLVLLIAVNSVYVSKNFIASFYGYLVMAVFTAAAVPTGWFLLKTGLVSDFEKYGITFSGVDFLLGPDRKIKLPDHILFLRWGFLYICAVFVLAYGQFVVSAGKIIPWKWFGGTSE